MVKKIELIDISELKTIRVICGNCNAAVESGIKNSGMAFNSLRCTFCEHPMKVHSHVTEMAKSISEIIDHCEKKSVQFVIDRTTE
tara:strand:- start:68 stop:322 length:255 start_codon:yes stop_codon:yes gene_type:complete